MKRFKDLNHGVWLWFAVFGEVPIAPEVTQQTPQSAIAVALGLPNVLSTSPNWGVQRKEAADFLREWADALDPPGEQP